MSYVLQEISREDQKRILRDAAVNSSAKHHLTYAMNQDQFPDKWAIDLERGIYLFFAPRFMREDSWSLPLYFHINDRFLMICSEGTPGYRMYLSEGIDGEGQLNEILDEIRDAFSAYGMWGEGPYNEKGEPQFRVDPRSVSVRGA